MSIWWKVKEQTKRLSAYNDTTEPLPLWTA